MKNLSKLVIITLSVILVTNSFIVNAQSTSVSTMSHEYEFDRYSKSFKKQYSIEGEELSIGFRKTLSSTQFLGFDQALIASNYLTLANQFEDPVLKNHILELGLGVIRFSTSLLNDPYSVENDGLVEFYDENLDETSYTRSSRYAKDQALLLLALDNALEVMDEENSFKSMYLSHIKSLWEFFDSRFYDQVNSGWFTKITPISQKIFSNDTSKRIYDNSLIILSLLNIQDYSKFDISKDSVLEKIKNSLDFMKNNFKQGNGIVSLGNADGSIISEDSYFAKDNALYGLANLAYYHATNEKSYLDEATSIWEFIKLNIYDKGFGGVFGGVSSSNLKIIAGKPLEDQIFFSLLSIKLAPFEDQFDLPFVDYFTLMNNIIKIRFVEKFTVYSSVDRKLNPSTERYSRSAAWYMYYLVQTPHLIEISSPDRSIIGADIPLTFNTHSYPGLNLSVVISTDYFNKTIVFNNITTKTASINFGNDIQSGYYTYEAQLYIKSSLINQITLFIDLNPNIRIPSGLLYLIGASVLAVIFIVIRRPPEWLKKQLSELERMNQTDTQTDTQSEDK